MNKKELIKQVRELIKDAREEYLESCDDRNSYGHGYDAGRLVGLREALDLLKDKNLR